MAKNNFGHILRRLRHGRDETLEQVSEATGLSVAMLSRIERGERLPSPDSVETLARHFELPVDYLMSETIANRMVNRYGVESTSRAAERMSREGVEFGLLAGSPEWVEKGLPEDAEGAGDDVPHPSPGRRPAYGPFSEMDVLAALSSAPGARMRSPERPTPSGPPDTPTPDDAESRVAGIAAVEPDALRKRLRAGPHEPSVAGRSESDGTRADIDPATERVLRAAKEASEAAAVLAPREAPSLSRAARIELIDRIGSLAAQAVDVLRMLASDPDERVRRAAKDTLSRLTRG